MTEDQEQAPAKRRTIHIETRWGSARRSNSRKERPCDGCRSRKSACVIPVQPPCRLCETRGVECTFTSSPTQRRRRPPVVTPTPSGTSTGKGSQQSEQSMSPLDHGSSSVQTPQETPTQSLPRESLLNLSHAFRKDPDVWTLQPPLKYEGQGYSPDHREQYVLPPLSIDGLASAALGSDPTYSHVRHFHLRNIVPDRSLPRRHSSMAETGDDESLEDAKGLTAHFMGLSSEQDADLLVSFRNNILNETTNVDVNIRQVFPGDFSQGKPPIHFTMIRNDFPERDQRAKQMASECIETHIGPHGDALVRLYFRFVHPMYPILSKSRFLASYAKDKLSILPSLRGAVYGLGCAFWDRDEELRHLPPVSQAELFDYTHNSLLRELDSPKLSTMQACLLIIHEQPQATGTTESPRIWTFACQATACAQSLGLHQNPDLWKIEPWEKVLRKKLWWAAYAADIWSSICHGNPPHIQKGSFNTADLTLEEMAVGEDVNMLAGGEILRPSDRSFNTHTAVFFLENTKLTKLLDVLLDTSFSIEGYRESALGADFGPKMQVLLTCKTGLEAWRQLLPQCLAMGVPSMWGDNNMNGPLHLAYFAARTLLFRALMSPANTLSKADPSSKLHRHLDAALVEANSFVDFMTKIRFDDLRVFWGRHARTNLILSGNFLIYLFLCASTADHVSRSYNSLWKYYDALKLLSRMVDQRSSGLIRPALLRAESFFKEAAEVMRGDKG